MFVELFSAACECLTTTLAGPHPGPLFSSKRSIRTVSFTETSKSPNVSHKKCSRVTLSRNVDECETLAAGVLAHCRSLKCRAVQIDPKPTLG